MTIVLSIVGLVLGTLLVEWFRRILVGDDDDD